MDNRRSLVATTTLTDKCGEAMGVPYAGGLLDSTRDVVVGVTQFVSQALNFVRRLSDRIVEDCESRRRGHSLFCCNTDEVKFVSVAVSNCLVNDCSSCWVLELSKITCENSCVYSLAAVQVHELAIR